MVRDRVDLAKIDTWEPDTGRFTSSMNWSIQKEEEPELAVVAPGEFLPGIWRFKVGIGDFHWPGEEA